MNTLYDLIQNSSSKKSESSFFTPILIIVIVIIMIVLIYMIFYSKKEDIVKPEESPPPETNIVSNMDYMTISESEEPTSVLSNKETKELVNGNNSPEVNEKSKEKQSDDAVSEEDTDSNPEINESNEEKSEDISSEINQLKRLRSQ